MATTGEAVVRLLEQYGTDTVFGIPGVHTLEIYRGLAASSIRHVAPRHEQGAGFMADAYSRISGKPGVCVLITGAGVANAATPIAGRVPRLDPDARDLVRHPLARPRRAAATAARPARPAGVHGHDHGRVDPRLRPRRAARRVRAGVGDLPVPTAAAGAHRRRRSTCSTCRPPGRTGSRAAACGRSPTRLRWPGPPPHWRARRRRSSCSAGARCAPATRRSRSPSASARRS